MRSSNQYYDDLEEDNKKYRELRKIVNDLSKEVDNLKKTVNELQKKTPENSDFIPLMLIKYLSSKVKSSDSNQQKKAMEIINSILNEYPSLNNKAKFDKEDNLQHKGNHLINKNYDQDFFGSERSFEDHNTDQKNKQHPNHFIVPDSNLPESNKNKEVSESYIETSNSTSKSENHVSMENINRSNPVLIYFSAPDNYGNFFRNDRKNDPDSRSVFKFALVSEDLAEVSFLENETAQKRAIKAFDTYLRNTIIDETHSHSSSAKEIIVLKPGKYKIEKDKWVKEDAIKVKFK